MSGESGRALTRSASAASNSSAASLAIASSFARLSASAAILLASSSWRFLSSSWRFLSSPWRFLSSSAARLLAAAAASASASFFCSAASLSRSNLAVLSADVSSGWVCGVCESGATLVVLSLPGLLSCVIIILDGDVDEGDVCLGEGDFVSYLLLWRVTSPLVASTSSSSSLSSSSILYKALRGGRLASTLASSKASFRRRYFCFSRSCLSRYSRCLSSSLTSIPLRASSSNRYLVVGSCC